MNKRNPTENLTERLRDIEHCAVAYQVFTDANSYTCLEGENVSAKQLQTLVQRGLTDYLDHWRIERDRFDEAQARSTMEPSDSAQRVQKHVKKCEPCSLYARTYESHLLYGEKSPDALRRRLPKERYRWFFQFFEDYEELGRKIPEPDQWGAANRIDMLRKSEKRE